MILAFFSDTSNPYLISSKFSSPTASQIANNSFNLPQRPITNIERLLSQAHWNHSFYIVNSSPSFQNSLPLSFPGTPPIITLSSNTLTPDPGQHSHHCIGKQPDTTRTYQTIPLKLDPKIIVPPAALVGDHNNSEHLHNWAKGGISQSHKITSVQKQRADELLKQSKITFSVETFSVENYILCCCRTRWTYFPTASCSTTYFRVKTNPSPFICQEIRYKFDRYTKNTAGYFVFYNPQSGLSYTCPLQIYFSYYLIYSFQVHSQ